MFHGKIHWKCRQQFQGISRNPYRRIFSGIGFRNFSEILFRKFSVINFKIFSGIGLENFSGIGYKKFPGIGPENFFRFLVNPFSGNSREIPWILSTFIPDFLRILLREIPQNGSQEFLRNCYKDIIRKWYLEILWN